MRSTRWYVIVSLPERLTPLSRKEITLSAVITSSRQTVYSANYGGDLTVAQCGWLPEVEAEYGIDAIVAGEAPVSTYIATTDGRTVQPMFARPGEDTGDPIYFEQKVLDGSVTHGWADSVSRKIIQVG